MPRADRVPFLPGRRLIAVRATLNELLDVILIADSGAQKNGDLATSRRTSGSQ
jgi:hypothetical protein